MSDIHIKRTKIKLANKKKKKRNIEKSIDKKNLHNLIEKPATMVVPVLRKEGAF